MADPRPDVAASPRLVDHVIVCGLHAEGLRVIEQLHQVGVPVVCVDAEPDTRLVRSVKRLGVPHIEGDARDPDVLSAAGIGAAAAVICVESDDLQTLGAALLARDLRPDVRVVVQLRNAAVGRALTGLGVQVLDVARLAAGSIVQACLRTETTPLTLGATDFVVAHTSAPRWGTLRDLYGDLAPIAVVGASGEVTVAPGRDRTVSEGDAVVLVGNAEQVRAEGLGARRTRTEPRTETYGGARAVRPPTRRPQSLLRTVLGVLDRRIRFLAVAMTVFAALSVAVLASLYKEADGRRLSIMDAAYFTVETMTTVGYGDFSFRSQQPWLRVWSIVLMVVGAALLAVAFALFTNVLVTRRLEETLGFRQVTGLEDHVVVVGLGSVGLAVVDGLLATGTPVVVVESDEESRFLGDIRARKVPFVLGDATRAQTLLTAQADRARAVAVLTSDDLANIEVGLAAREVVRDRPVPVVLRVFGRSLARTLSSNLSFPDVRSTAALAAPWFVGAALGLDVLSTFYVADQPLLVARLPISAAGGLAGVPMAELGARIRVVALERGTEVEQLPRRDARFRAGDVAYTISPYKELLQVLQVEAAGHARLSNTESTSTRPSLGA